MELYLCTLAVLPLIVLAQNSGCRDNYGTPFREGEEHTVGNSWLRCWNGNLTLAGCVLRDGQKIGLGQTMESKGYVLTCEEVSPMTSYMSPTACLHEQRVLQPGESAETPFYVYTCRQQDTGVSLEITACVDDTGRQVAPGEQVVRGDYQYQCSLANGFISLRPTSCLYDGVSFPAGTTFDGDKFFFACELQGDTISRRILGCLDRNGGRIQPGDTFQKNGFVKRCEKTYYGNGVTTRVIGCTQTLENGEIVDHKVGSQWLEGVSPFEYTVYCTTCTDGVTVMKSLTKCNMVGPSGTFYKTPQQYAKYIETTKNDLDPGCMRPVGYSLACCGTTYGGGLRLHLDDYSPENIEKWRQKGYRMC